jgi:hypothetical protein
MVNHSQLYRFTAANALRRAQGEEDKERRAVYITIAQICSVLSTRNEEPPEKYAGARRTAPRH